jgi:hypothetical protein
VEPLVFCVETYPSGEPLAFRVETYPSGTPSVVPGG